MMTTIRVLTWYYLKFALWMFPGMVAMMVLGPWAISGLMQLKAGEPVTPLTPDRLYFTFVGIGGFFALIAATTPITELFARSRLHVLPVSNRFAGTFLWMVPTLIVAAFMLLVQACYIMIFKATWPVSTTVAMTSITCLLLTTLSMWLHRLTLWRVGFGAMVLMVWVWWIARHFFPNGWQQPFQLWQNLSVSDAMILTATCIACRHVMIDSFAQARCGRSNLQDVIQALQKAPREFFDRMTAAGQTASAPEAEESLSLMSRQNARGALWGLMAAEFILSACMLSIVVLTPDSRHDNGSAIVVVTTVMMCGFVGGSLLGLGMGNEIRAKQGAMRTYYGTLPFSDRSLSRTALKQTWRLSLWLWLAAVLSMTVLLLLLTVILNLSNGAVAHPFLTNLWTSASLYRLMIAAGVLAAYPVTWAVCAFLLSTVVFDRRNFVAGSILTGAGVIVGLIFLGEFCGPIGHQIAEVGGVLMVLGILLTTILLFRNAVRKNLLPVIVLPAAIGILAVTAAASLLGPGLHPAAGLYLTITALLMLPLPALPLAIADSRHR
ncbi:MAG: hypothetical protein R3C49_11300 [Planctomycetaceae bacterium]